MISTLAVACFVFNMHKRKTIIPIHLYSIVNGINNITTYIILNLHDILRNEVVDIDKSTTRVRSGAD